MITEIGHYALVLALFVALFQATVPLYGAWRGDIQCMRTASTSATVLLLLIGVSFGVLTYAYVTSDFSVLNVAQNSHSAKPFLYKISGVWGNHEGSMLLWVLILALFGFAVALFGKNIPQTLKARVISVQGMIALGFLAFVLFTSNPFKRLFPPPLDGNGLNPILQDPGLALHPPFLYLGYVGFSVAFSFAIAALIEGRVDPAWGRWVRPWTLAAWCFLTLGIGLGSWWAYYELGWGGWWFWDPVENASFMPWLVGTALLHSAIVVEKRDSLKAWTVLLAIIAFAMSLLGTFLVRSGVLTSVHSFASDPTRGVFVLALLIAAVGGSLMLFAFRASELKTGGLFAGVSREGALVANNLLMSTAAATVLLGTLYPLFVDVMGAGKISVGAPFFNNTFVPLMVPLVVLMGIGPLMSWKRSDLQGVYQRLRIVVVAAVIGALYAWAEAEQQSIWAAAGFGLSVWLGLATLVEFADRIKLFRVSPISSAKKALRVPGSAYGMTFAHLGVAIVIAGITGVSFWQEEKIQVMKIGDTVAVGGHELTLQNVREVMGPNYKAERATFEVRRDGEPITFLYPEKRVYLARNQPTTEAAIDTTWIRDLYAVLGDPDDQGGWVTRLYFKPFVPWLWVGALLMALGAVVSLADRRFRLGAPTKSRPKALSANAKAVEAS